MVGGAHQEFRRLEVQKLPVDLEGFDILRREVAQLEARFPRVSDRLVVHVGQVHHLADFVATVSQVPAQSVLKDKSAEVADMRIVIDRRPAGVDSHLVAFQGTKLVHPRGQRVVEAQRHTTTRVRSDSVF